MAELRWLVARVVENANGTFGVELVTVDGNGSPTGQGGARVDCTAAPDVGDTLTDLGELDVRGPRSDAEARAEAKRALEEAQQARDVQDVPNRISVGGVASVIAPDGTVR